MTARAEPRTRQGVLAQGRVRIVATPTELTARRGWWRDWQCGQVGDGSAFTLRQPSREDRAVMKRALSTTPSVWQRPAGWEHNVVKPVREHFAAADQRNADANREYRGGRLHPDGAWRDTGYVAPRDMTAAQKCSVLDAEYRRLSRQATRWESDAECVEIEVQAEAA